MSTTHQNSIRSRSPLPTTAKQPKPYLRELLTQAAAAQLPEILNVRPQRQNLPAHFTGFREAFAAVRRMAVQDVSQLARGVVEGAVVNNAAVFGESRLAELVDREAGRVERLLPKALPAPEVRGRTTADLLRLSVQMRQSLENVVDRQAAAIEVLETMGFVGRCRWVGATLCDFTYAVVRVTDVVRRQEQSAVESVQQTRSERQEVTERTIRTTMRTQCDVTVTMETHTHRIVRAQRHRALGKLARPERIERLAAGIAGWLAPLVTVVTGDETKRRIDVAHEATFPFERIETATVVRRSSRRLYPVYRDPAVLLADTFVLGGWGLDELDN